MFDSHCHLTDGRFDEDRAPVLRRAREAGVTRIVTIASNLQDAREAADFAARHEGIWSTAGVHPHEVAEAGENDLEGIRELARDRPEVVAIGETGLDFFYDNSPRDLQRLWFERHLELGAELGLPVVVHSREAEADTVDLIRDAADSVRMVLHCFTGSRRLLEAALEAECYVSFSGIVSFGRFDGQEEVRAVPGDRLLAETDSPYLAPAPHRGRRNEPAYVADVIEAIAEIRGETKEAVAEYTASNAATLYAIQS